MISFSQDTPIKRASIKDLTADQLEALVVQMQEHRMRSYTAYQELMAAKAKIKEEKDKLRYDKVLGMLEKRLDAAEKALTAASGYVSELRLAQLVMGE